MQEDTLLAGLCVPGWNTQGVFQSVSSAFSLSHFLGLSCWLAGWLAGVKMEKNYLYTQ